VSYFDKSDPTRNPRFFVRGQKLDRFFLPHNVVDLPPLPSRPLNEVERAFQSLLRMTGADRQSCWVARP
jgi:hypothetical protein